MTTPSQDRKCRDCGKPGNPQHCYQIEWSRKNPTAAARRQREYRNRQRPILRKQIFELLGSKCKCCGESEPLFLTIDHINEDGWKERRRTENGRYYLGSIDRLQNYINSIKEDPSNYQILCSNCNIGKHRNNGVCPHNKNDKV